MINVNNGLPTNFADQFADTFYHVCQQQESLFGRAVNVKPLLNAEDRTVDIIGKFNLVQKTARSTKTPSTVASTQRRWLTTEAWHQSVPFDKDDDLSLILKPMGDFQRGLLSAVNRKKDDIILASFDATVAAGRHPNSSSITWASENGNTKYTDSSGGRTIPWDCSEGNCVASDTGMTTEKAQLILEYFAKNEVPDNIPIFCAINPRQATQMFGQEQFVNVDYNTDKPLASGRFIKNWMNINWISSNKIVKGSSNDVDVDSDVYRCWAWAQDGVTLGIQDSVTTKISELPEQSYDQQVYVYMNMGALRVDEDKVLCVECK
jgi:hypothetical protein